MLDSHCHLTDKQFSSDLPEVLVRAREVGVERIICIADSLEEGGKCLELSKKYEQIFCSVGVHPHNAKSWKAGDGRKLIDIVRCGIHSEPNKRNIVAIGEIGLDYFYDNSPRDVQRAVFREQLEIAKELELPAVIHCREAVEDIRSIIAEVDPPQLVIHCCTEQWEDVRNLVERGYFLSFTGIATYPKSEVIRETIRQCPIEQLMIETDAPYLAPVPHRGKRNEPAYVVEVARCIAEVKGLSPQEVDAQTTKNAVAFFGLAP